MIFAEVLHATRLREPDKLALVFGSRRYTYAELDDVTDLLAAALAAAGVARDDRVALFLPNRPELVFCYLACFKLGAIAVPLNHRYRTGEAEYALEHSGSTTLIVHEDKLDDALGLPFERLPLVRRYLVRDAAAKIVDTAARQASHCRGNELPTLAVVEAEFAPFESLLSGKTAPLPEVLFDERQLATIMYTSGTTANPKGVVHSQETLWHCVQIQATSMEYTSEDVILVSTSAAHCAASYGLIFPNIFVGGTSVMLHAPTPEQVVQAIVEHGVTRCQMLPASLQDLVEYLEHRPTPLPSLRSFFAGGDIVPLDTHRRFRAATGLDVAELCGMTEAITYAVNPPFGEKRIGSVGKPVERTQVRIADEHGRALPVGAEGEIQIRGPANMLGYWNDTLHTTATLHDGWLASGDLGRFDADGYLWFMGRKKEIIIRGGSNISPLEVEQVIDQHPAVHLCGVVGAPDARLGQIVIAYVSLLEDAEQKPTPEELKAFAAERIAEYKVPERFFLLDALPLNSTNKVDRKKLHERVAGDLGI
ncbi:MAG: AMP-binding protein [Pirellulales bacterium]|nr:AMP-binding protein [Pirellulales bacterium]